MDEVIKIIESAKIAFRKRLEGILNSPEGLSEEYYARYLSMQYHLTKGVQRHFFTAASHADLARKRNLRKFLVQFANEEELHFELAAKDLRGMQRIPIEIPLDVELWWAYFDKVVHQNPFLRLGATCVLENIASGSQDVIEKLFAGAKFLSEDNIRFFTVHRHDENLPHGDQILSALKRERLDPNHIADLVRGAQVGMNLYLRMVDWAFQREAPLAHISLTGS